MHRLAAALLCVSLVPAQSVAELRFELGQRLRRMEAAWAATPREATAKRERASALVEQAVASFFKIDQIGAARKIDEAWLTLVQDEPVDALARFGAALSLRLDRRLLDPAKGGIRLRVEPLYPIEGIDEPPAEATVVLDVTDGRRPTRSVQPMLEMPLEFELPLGGRSKEQAFGFVIGAELRVGGRRYAMPKQHLASVPGLADELASWRADDEPTLESATLEMLRRTLDVLAKGRHRENDLPVLQRWRQAAALAAGKLRFGDETAGDLHLSVPLEGGRKQSIRMLVPKRAADDEARRPLVLALHGMGGSENLFFDGHGELAVQLANERGWYLCAPKNIAAGRIVPLLNALRERFAFDPDRVLVMGHSMGAGVAVAAAQQVPEAFRAVTAIGGSGAVRNARAVDELPFRVITGENDFARGGAERLHRILDQAGVESKLTVLDTVEHMLVVQEGLPETFAFFDSVLRRNPR